jgi:hypothetical protein
MGVTIKVMDSWASRTRILQPEFEDLLEVLIDDMRSGCAGTMPVEENLVHCTIGMVPGVKNWQGKGVLFRVLYRTTHLGCEQSVFASERITSQFIVILSAANTIHTTISQSIWTIR